MLVWSMEDFGGGFRDSGIRFGDPRPFYLLILLEVYALELRLGLSCPR